ncbi:Aspartate racemase [Roseovarius sp. THAF8]|uniref:aspartate/glutamate racemase family protein n=1 Tax=Roseovarius sp. THAF8 TaxID=2587846 RepID=UPI0012A88428|nr:amino acid racemase [Roseovarius sp. THAF8]QFT97344.1 Aspartate racemase [Roseovarius sp. THAF8]
MKPVGILGGMGPEATILLMQKVLSAIPAQDDADHVPLIVHQNPQVPSRIKALIDGDGQDPMPVLMSMAQDLERAGAQALAMPCNTAHHYAVAVANATSLPFLDMIELTARHLGETGAGTVGMLASPATRKVGVFDTKFDAHDLKPLWADDEDDLLDIIRAVKAGSDLTTLAPHMGRIAAGMADKGADHLLIACTELSLMSESLPDAIPYTDSLDCLVKAVVDFSTK